MRSNSRGWLWILATVLVLVAGAFPAWPEDAGSPSDAIAVVNDSVITQEDFDDEMGRVQQMLMSRGMPLTEAQVSEVRGQVLESLINREVLYQESQNKGIEVDAAAVEAHVQTLRKRFPSEIEFQSALDQMNLSEKTLRTQVEREMAIQELIDQQIGGTIIVTEKDSKSFYDSHPDTFRQPEEIRASHILIRVDPQADQSEKARARQEIEAIQKKLREGEDFATLAKEFSQGPSSSRGGDLNYFRRGQMAKPFEDAAFALDTGETSDIVETEFGYHLIKVTDRRPETTIAYEGVKEKIDAYLKEERIREETGKYAEELKEQADIRRLVADGP